jgi:hypothetical protein
MYPWDETNLVMVYDLFDMLPLRYIHIINTNQKKESEADGQDHLM